MERPRLDSSSRADAQLAAIVEDSDDAIISTDLDGTIVTWNRGAEQLYGYRAEDIVGKSVAVLYPVSERGALERILEQIRSGIPAAVEGIRQRQDGTLIPVEVRVSTMFDNDGIAFGASAIARDVTERNRKEEELRESQTFLEHTQKVGHIGSWRADVGAAALLTMSPEARRILGFEPEQVVRNLDFYNILHSEDQARIIETLLATRNRGTRSEVEGRVIHPDGAERWVQIVADLMSGEPGEFASLVGVIIDITERKAVEAAAAKDALFDRLSGLANRTLLLDRTDRAIARAVERGMSVAVVFLDLDRFKDWNEARGRSTGDAILRAAGERLRRAVSPTETVARITADEYVVTCENIMGSADAMQRATSLLEWIRRPMVLAEGEFITTASAGIAIGAAGSTAESLVRDAELAMYRAKQGGRDRVELYDLTLRRQAHQRLALEAGLRHALDSDELVLEYQPIASLAENRFVGAEALLRWRNADLGLVPPGEFIGIAEDMGLIAAIGAWVFGTACQQLRRWESDIPQQLPWTVSINVSPAQLRDREFLSVIERGIEQAGIAGSSVILELTESMLVDESLTREVLRAVRSLGVRLCIDDFGTKYSALSYLQSLPVDELKVDRSFIKAVSEDEIGRKLVAAIVALGQALGVRVTAEGVETVAQLQILRDLGCCAVQGFCLSGPISADKTLALLGTSLPRSLD